MQATLRIFSGLQIPANLDGYDVAGTLTASDGRVGWPLTRPSSAREMGRSTMSQTRLEGARIAILVADDFEQVEMTEPRKALDSAGATTLLISTHAVQVRGMHHDLDWTPSDTIAPRRARSLRPEKLLRAARPLRRLAGKSLRR